jgi:hypothetical protein
MPAMPKPTRTASVWCAISAEDDRTAVAEPFGDGAEQGLADAPGEVLDGDGEREFGARPAELRSDRNLEHAEACADGEGQHDDDAAPDQNRGDERRAGVHVGLLSRRGKLLPPRAKVK